VHAFLLERPVQAMDLAGDARWAPPADAATVHGVGAALAALLELAAEAQRSSGCRAASRTWSRARRWSSRPRAR
jgi:hypothetical protein